MSYQTQYNKTWQNQTAGVVATTSENAYSGGSTNMNYTYLSDMANSVDADSNKKISRLFANTKGFKDVTQYNLMRGVPDFGSLVQFNPYETGYAAFIICEIPKFMEMLARIDTSYKSLIDNWCHIIEYEFKSFDGLQDMSADTIQLGDDLNNINVINKVNMQSASEFTLVYDEKSGSPLTKFAKLYLSGIKDPRTQVKTYHGLIHSGLMEPGFENEVFTFLYIATDNTMREVEAAYLLIGCQLNSADLDMYNYTKGDINKRDVNVKFSGYPVTSSAVEGCAKDMLTYLLSVEAGARQIIVNSNDFNYTGISSIADTFDGYRGTAGNTSSNAESGYKHIAAARGGYASKYSSDSMYEYEASNSTTNS